MLIAVALKQGRAKMTEMGFLEKAVVNSGLSRLFHKWFGVGKLLRQIDVGRPKRILELGCGVGATTSFIAAKFNHADITALDYDERQIEVAKSRQAAAKRLGNATFAVGDAANLEFKSNSFDVVFEILTFHHIPNYERAIKEVHRVLRKKGSFVVMEIAAKSINPLHRLIKFQPAEFTKEGFIRKLETAGLALTWSKGNVLFSLEAVKQ